MKEDTECEEKAPFPPFAAPLWKLSSRAGRLSARKGARICDKKM
jgi:hypothetical protein